MSYPATGTCQCRNVHYVVKQPPVITVVCYCTDCQKTSAGALSITMMLDREDFELLNGELAFYDRKADSGNTARCFFCPTCSNRIYHENPENNQVIRLKPGTLDDTSIIKPEMHVWTRSAQPWVELPSHVPCHETQPDMATILGR